MLVENETPVIEETAIKPVGSRNLEETGDGAGVGVAGSSPEPRASKSPSSRNGP